MTAPTWLAVLVLVAVVLGLYALMWRGWRRRGAKHDLPPLVDVPVGEAESEVRLQSGGRYVGTTVAGDGLDRVVARGLGPRSTCRLTLTDAGLDVVRAGGAFRVPAASLRGARHEQGIAGKVVPPHGLVVVTWQHGDLTLDTGFRMTEFDLGGSAMPGENHAAWIQAIVTMVKEENA